MAKKRGRSLHIGTQTNLMKALKEYCKETDIDTLDVGYNLGTLTGKDDEKRAMMFTLLEMAFFSGIYFLKKYPQKVVFKYSSEKDWENFKKKIAKIKQEDVSETTRTYFG